MPTLSPQRPIIPPSTSRVNQPAAFNMTSPFKKPVVFKKRVLESWTRDLSAPQVQGSIPPQATTSSVFQSANISTPPSIPPQSQPQAVSNLTQIPPNSSIPPQSTNPSQSQPQPVSNLTLIPPQSTTPSLNQTLASTQPPALPATTANSFLTGTATATSSQTSILTAPSFLLPPPNSSQHTHTFGALPNPLPLLPPQNPAPFPSASIHHHSASQCAPSSQTFDPSQSFNSRRSVFGFSAAVPETPFRPSYLQPAQFQGQLTHKPQQYKSPSQKSFSDLVNTIKQERSVLRNGNPARKTSPADCRHQVFFLCDGITKLVREYGQGFLDVNETERNIEKLGKTYERIARSFIIAKSYAQVYRENAKRMKRERYEAITGEDLYGEDFGPHSTDSALPTDDFLEDNEDNLDMASPNMMTRHGETGDGSVQMIDPRNNRGYVIAQDEQNQQLTNNELEIECLTPAVNPKPVSMPGNYYEDEIEVIEDRVDKVRVRAPGNGNQFIVNVGHNNNGDMVLEQHPIPPSDPVGQFHAPDLELVGIAPEVNLVAPLPENDFEISKFTSLNQ